MFGLLFTVGVLVVLVVAIRVSSTYEVKHGLINLRKDNDYEGEKISLPHVRAGSPGRSENASVPDRVLLGAVT